MISYLEKHNLQYFSFSPNSEKNIKAVMRHLPPDTPADIISSSLEDLGFNVINVRQLTTIEDHQMEKPSGKPPSIPCYLKKERKISRDIQAE
jgi:Leucine-rich repeat (LRR) protein